LSLKVKPPAFKKPLTAFRIVDILSWASLMSSLHSAAIFVLYCMVMWKIIDIWPWALNISCTVHPVLSWCTHYGRPVVWRHARCGHPVLSCCALCGHPVLGCPGLICNKWF
jgi:hypothetical protein